MSETAPLRREPRIYDHVEAPDGHDCQLWSVDDEGAEPTPCDRDAAVLFVHEASLDPDDDCRRNALACAECAPVEVTADA